MSKSFDYLNIWILEYLCFHFVSKSLVLKEKIPDERRERQNYAYLYLTIFLFAVHLSIVQSMDRLAHI